MSRRTIMSVSIFLGLLILADPSKVSAQIAHVKTIGATAATATGTSISVTVPASGVAAGNRVIVSLAMNPSTGTVACSDTGGNSYTVDRNVANGSGTTGVRTVILSAHVATALVSGNTITCTHPSVTARALSANEFSGLAISSAVDRVASATGNNTAPSSGSTSTTTQASELLIGGIGVEGPTTETFTAGANYTLVGRSGTSGGTAANNITINPEYRVVSATGAYSATGTLSSSRRWAAAIVTYKATPLPKLVVTSINGGANPTAGAGFSVVVQSQTASGTPTNVNSHTNVSLSLKTGTGILGGNLTGTIAAGTNEVTINGATYTKAESGVVLTATRTSGDILNPGDSAPFTVHPGAASALAFTAQPGNATAGGAIPGPPTVAVLDSFDNTVTSSTVSITLAIGANPGGGTLGGTTTLNASAGVASFAAVSINNLGTGYTLTASATGLTMATSNAFNVHPPPPPTKLAITSVNNGASPSAGASFPVTVQSQDPSGAPSPVVTTTDVSLDLKTGTSFLSGTLSGTILPGTSQVIFDDVRYVKAESGVSITASVVSGDSLTPGDSAPFTVASGAAAFLTFTNQPATSVAGSPVHGPPIITVQDLWNNIVTSFSESISLTLTRNPAAGTLSGTTSKTATSGVATFTDISIDNPGAGYRLGASAPGLSTAESFLFTIDPVAPTSIKKVTRGSVTFNSGANRMPINLSLQVDPTKTIVWGGISHGGGRGASANANATRIGFDLESGWTLALERKGSPANTPTVEWQLVEFSTGAFVQRGLWAFTTSETTVNVTLPDAVDLNKTFVLVSVAPNSSSQTIDERWTIRSRLTSPTTLELSRAESGTAVDVYWQVIQIESASVQRGLTPITAGTASASATIEPINTPNSFLVMNFRAAAASNGIESQSLARGAITNNTTLTFDRISTSNSIDIAWEVVSFNDGTSVQSGTRATTSASDTLLDQAITAIDPNRTFAYISADGGTGTATDGLDDVSWTAALTSDTNLQLQRGASGTNGAVEWQVVEFPAPPIATKLAIASVSDGFTINATSSFYVRVQSQDGNGVPRPVAGNTAVILSLHTGTGPLGGTLTGTILAGSSEVMISGITYTKAESGVVLTATRTSGDSLTAGNSIPFTVNSGPPSLLLFTTMPSTSVAGSPISGPVTLAIRDKLGNVVTSAEFPVNIYARLSSDSVPLAGTVTKVASAGVVVFDDIRLDKAASGYSLLAFAVGAGLNDPPSNFFQVIPAEPTHLGFTIPPGHSVLGATIPGPPAVAVQDAYGNVVPSSSATITAAIGNNPSGGTLTGTTVRNTTSGTATFNDLKINQLGTGYTLAASAPGLVNATSTPFNISSNVSTSISLVFTTQPRNSTVNGTIPGPVEISVVDQFGARVTTSTAPVTISIGTNPSGGTITGTATKNAVGGIVIFGDLKIDAAGSGYTLLASSAGLTGSTSSTFDVSAPTAKIAYIYDRLNRLKAVVDPASDTAIYDYDAVGNLLTIARQPSTQLSLIEFSPTSGAIGATVTIHGSGFSPVPTENTVKFSGITATVISSTATEILASVPSGAATGPVSVSRGANTVTSGTDFTVFGMGGPPNAPTISGITPEIGVPGTAVTITGTNFHTAKANNRVLLNISRPTVTSNTQTSISFNVPTVRASGKISVETPYGKALSPVDFFVPPSPYTAADVIFKTRMAVGGSTAANVTSGGKIALVLFDALKNQQISLSANDNIPNYTDLKIISPDGSTVATLTVWDSALLDTVTLPLTGTYTIVVDPQQATATGSMNVSLNTVDHFTGSISMDGPAVNASISTPGQNVRLSFEGIGGQRVSALSSNATATGCQPRLAILKPDGTELVGVTAPCSATSIFIEPANLPMTGTYILTYNPPGEATGQVTLNLYNVVDVEGAIVPGGSPVNATVATPGQNVRLTFSGSTGQNVGATSTNSTVKGCTPRLSILRPDGTELAGANGNCAAGNISIGSTSLPTTGTYTLMYNAPGAATGQMTLTLSTP